MKSIATLAILSWTMAAGCGTTQANNDDSDNRGGLGGAEPTSLDGAAPVSGGSVQSGVDAARGSGGSVQSGVDAARGSGGSVQSGVDAARGSGGSVQSGVDAARGSGDARVNEAGPDAFREAQSATDAGTPLRIAIPLYVRPGEGAEWSQVAAAGRTVSFVIANAGDPGGPGPAADSAYSQAIANAHEAGQRVVGYVDTNYGTRRLDDVLSDIDHWYDFYSSIDGIFLDLTPASADRVAGYYTPASNRIRSKSGDHVVIINPGQPDFDESYMTLADVAMSYENPYGSPTDGYAEGQYASPSWMTKYSPERFWHVVLEVADTASMQDVVRLTRTRNVGNLYITNYADPPAYERLPAYFSDECRAAEAP